jgi:uncharacterized protein with ParB-like and HNH nuclease domain
MELAAEQFSLSGLLGGGNKINIPDYQRNYAWDATNIDQYFEDLTTVIESKEDHFFGPIVLLDEGDLKYSVIDGQQRLTTTIMLLCLIRDRLSEMDDPNHRIGDTKLPLKTLVDQMLKLNNFVEYRFTANHQIRDIFHYYILIDQGVLRKTLTKGGAGLDPREKEATRALRSAYFRLKDSLTGLLQEHAGNEDSLKQFMFELINALKDSLKVLRIVVPDENDAYVLFETLNDRGVRLSAADLLKSYTLREAKGLDLVTVEDVIAQWDLAGERLGSYSFEKFLRHYLLSTQTVGKVQTKKIFAMFKERINQRGALQNLEDIAEASYIYAMLINKEIETLDDDLNATLDRINMFSETHRVFLLPVIGGTFSDEAKNYAARATEMLAFRWTLRGGNAQVLENLYQRYAGRVRDEALPDRAVALTQILEDLMNEAPSDEEVRNEILSSAPKANLLKYVLTRVEGALTGDLLRWTKQPTSVDQFAPKNPSDDSDWHDLIAPAKVGVDQKSYGEYSQMWGNQTLIEFDLHGSLKHTSWSKKVQGLLEHKGLKESHVDMNADVCTKDRWTKDLIVKRTEWMAEAVALITSVAAAQNDKVRIQSFS